METKTLTSTLSVSAQIAVTDISQIVRAGFKAIICNRPDDEGSDQPGFHEIEAAADLACLPIRYLPVESGRVTDQHGVSFGQLMDELPKPILAYCRTGMRSTTMWALSQAGKVPFPQIIEAAAKAGFDLHSLVPRITNGGKTPVSELN